VGGVLSSDTIGGLKARVVAGSANNTLAGPEIAGILFQRGITYVPDYLINAGAVIQGVRFLMTGERQSPETIRKLGTQTRELLATAARLGEPPAHVLDRQTRARLQIPHGWRAWSWPSAHREG
jgi:leucine dehydrogenase